MKITRKSYLQTHLDFLSSFAEKSTTKIAIEVEKDVIETNIDSQDPYFEFKQTIALFSWLDKNCPRVRFVLKTCSDIFINTNKLIELADQEMYASNRMYGDLLRRIGAERKKESKLHHPVSLEEWPWRYTALENECCTPSS